MNIIEIIIIVNKILINHHHNHKLYLSSSKFREEFRDVAQWVVGHPVDPHVIEVVVGIIISYQIFIMTSIIVPILKSLFILIHSQNQPSDFIPPRWCFPKELSYSRSLGGVLSLGRGWRPKPEHQRV